MSLLVLAWGNRQREDDGLGPVLAGRLRATTASHAVSWRQGVQLDLDQVLDMAEHGLVLFVDAALGLGSDFEFRELSCRPGAFVNSHHLSPVDLMSAYRRAYHRPPPPCFLLAVRGGSFRPGRLPGGEARRSLAAAEVFGRRLLLDPRPDVWRSLQSVRTPTGQPSAGDSLSA